MRGAAEEPKDLDGAVVLRAATQTGPCEVEATWPVASRPLARGALRLDATARSAPR